MFRFQMQKRIYQKKHTNRNILLTIVIKYIYLYIYILFISYKVI